MKLQEETKNRYRRVGLAVLAVVLLTALAVDAAMTRVKALHITPSLAHPGQMLQAAVELSIPAPSGGVTIELAHQIHPRGNDLPPLAVSDSGIELPSSIFIPAGKTTGLFTIDILHVTQPVSLVVKARLNNTEQIHHVHLMPQSLPARATAMR